MFVCLSNVLSCSPVCLQSRHKDLIKQTDACCFTSGSLDQLEYWYLQSWRSSWKGYISASTSWRELRSPNGGTSQQALSFNMVAHQHKSIPHKASFLPLTVGQKSLFSPLAPLLFSSLSPLLFLILLFSLPLPSTFPLSCLLPLLFYIHPFPPPLLPSLLTPLLLPPGPAGLCGANHQTAAPLSPLTEQLPPPQQYTTPLGQSPARAATIQDPHLANRGGGFGARRPQWSNGRHAACELLRSHCGSLERRPLVLWDN